MTTRKASEEHSVPSRVEVDTDALAEAADLLGGELERRDLTIWRLPPAGGGKWVDSDGNMVETITGLVVASQQVRAWWPSSFGVGEDQPGCSSDDGRTGSGEFGRGSLANPTGACADCPKSAWGTALNGGAGQACRASILLFLVQDGQLIPDVLQLAPTSHTPFRRWVMRRLPNKPVGSRIRVGTTMTQDGPNLYPVATFEDLGFEGTDDGDHAFASGVRQLVRPGTPIVSVAAIAGSMREIEA